MKKTFLSMALVLSISLAFGAETKPVADESKLVSLTEKSKEISVEKPTIDSKIVINKKSKIKSLSETECFILSCTTVCITDLEKEFSCEETLEAYEVLDWAFCDAPL